MKTYFKVICCHEDASSGAVGHDELFGDVYRYWRSRVGAQDAADRLNAVPGLYAGTYRVEERCIYADGAWDDSDDTFAREQLGL